MKKIFKMQNEKSRMKNIKLFKKIIFFLALLFSAQLSFAQVEDSKTVKKDFEPEDIVRLVHSHGPMVVKNSTNGKVHIEAVFSAKAKDRENLDIFLDHFGVKGLSRGNTLEISTTSGVESWNSTNKVTTIKFTDGQKAKGIRDVVLSATLYIPDLEELQLKNKYGDISFEANAPGNLKVDLFSGKLETNKPINDFDLTLKYGKCYISDVKKSKLNLFDSDIRTGNLDDTQVTSKYSECEIMDVQGELTLQTFDDKWKMGNIGGLFKFNDKYSEYKLETFGEAEGTIFDGEVVATSGKKLILHNSKYSKYRFSNIDEFRSIIAFDDDIEIGKAHAVSARNSKYSSYRINGIQHSFSSNESFDDDIKIGRISADFNHISMDGKYTKMEFNIDDGAQFEVSVLMQYGKFDHPDFDVRVYREINNKTEISGYVGKEKAGAPKRLTISGFDNQVYWR